MKKVGKKFCGLYKSTHELDCKILIPLLSAIYEYYNERKVSFGQLFVAMLFNGLGFTSRT
ncbi:hypothetical protein CBQ28_09035 [Pseudoalteromonas sp. GCY]|nr:hypothetical protein CBQ28_09035 [Pseudoalteromonas sp. GCY]